jgi:hypothetical protein
MIDSLTYQLGSVASPLSNLVRFWEKVDIGDPDECWPWTATKNHLGYGLFRLPRFGRMVVAHRFAWGVSHGEIPIGRVIMHSCDNPACCNTNHLRLGTQSENMFDAVRKGRK